MRRQNKSKGSGQSGFTLMEVLVATVILLVGMVAVAQLVPISLTINSGNRTGSTALVIEQRILPALTRKLRPGTWEIPGRRG
jgi:prepilin-type N-terminal cleavage/methylation domain-containing protein